MKSMSCKRAPSYLSMGCLALQLLSGCSSDDPPAEQVDEDVQKEEQEQDEASGQSSSSAGGSSGKGDAKVDAGSGSAAKKDAASEGASGRVDSGAAALDAGAARPKADGGQPPDAGGAGAPEVDTSKLEPFSFFVTSLKAMQELSKNQSGFGGDLRFGETGEGAGLRGADKICTTIAEKSMQGSGAKGWRAFLSATKGGEGGGPVHAIDRIGDGPWYDRLGRLVANNKTELAQTRPTTADPEIKNDLPNEDGVPNHDPDGTGEVDNHDILTGTNNMGKLYANDVRVTCNDWTKSTPDANDAPRVGHSWPRAGFGGGFGGRPGGGGAGFPGGGAFDTENWMSALDEAGCGAGVSLIEMGPPMENNPTVGSGGGYGGIYCFALKP